MLRWLRTATVVLASFAPCACAPTATSGPSHVVQSRYYATGHPDYDEFFLAVYRAQVEGDRAPRALDDARAALRRAVAADPAVDDGAVFLKLRGALRDLAARGVRLRLRAPNQNAGTSSELELVVTGAVPEERLELVRDLDFAATTLSRTKTLLDATQRRLAPLSPAPAELEAAAEAHFVREAQRADVRRNLRDAYELLPSLRQRIDELTQEVDGLLTNVRRVVESATQPSQEADEAPRPRPRTRIRSRSAPPP